MRRLPVAGLHLQPAGYYKTLPGEGQDSGRSGRRGAGILKIIVCIKQLPDGSLNPFDTSALESALRIEDICRQKSQFCEITVVSMGRLGMAPLLEDLTRLGNVKGVLLSDKDFAGADTLATSKTLAAWMDKQDYDLILCGRQSIDGETAQVGPEIAQMLGILVKTCVLAVELAAGTEANKNVENDATENTGARTGIICQTRIGTEQVALPCVVTMERSNVLRFPSLWAKKKEVLVQNREDLGIPAQECGLMGSPTRVLESYENTGGRRKCRYISASELTAILDATENKSSAEQTEYAKHGQEIQSPRDAQSTEQAEEREGNRGKNAALAGFRVAPGEKKLDAIWVTNEELLPIGNILAQKTVLVPLKEENLEAFLEKVRKEKPAVILTPADWESRSLAPRAAAALQTGLCADCTGLVVEEKELHMIRPALAGNRIAKIRCRTFPVMATIRTAGKSREELVFAIGKGALSVKNEIIACAEKYRGTLAASRACVESGGMPYEWQVGLTGRSIAPKIYLAFGISGAVHHIVGMERSGTVIAVNTDPNAPIFSYADYGIVGKAEDVLRVL